MGSQAGFSDRSTKQNTARQPLGRKRRATGKSQRRVLASPGSRKDDLKTAFADEFSPTRFQARERSDSDCVCCLQRALS